MQDGKNAEIRSVEVSIQDVQDSPPKFTSQMRAVVREDLSQVCTWSMFCFVPLAGYTYEGPAILWISALFIKILLNCIPFIYMYIVQL